MRNTSHLTDYRKTTAVILALFLSMLLAAGAFAQCTCTRLKTQYGQFQLAADPVRVKGQGVLWLDNTDTLPKMRMPDNSIMVLASAGSVTYSPWDSSAGNVFLRTLTDKVGVGTATPDAKFSVLDTSTGGGHIDFYLNAGNAQTGFSAQGLIDTSNYALYQIGAVESQSYLSYANYAATPADTSTLGWFVTRGITTEVRSGNSIISIRDTTGSDAGSIILAVNEDTTVTVTNELVAVAGNVSISSGLIFTLKAINTTAGDGATINAPAGRFRKDASGSSFTLTNSFITANSILIPYLITPALTAGNNVKCVAGAGSAVCTFESAAGAAEAPNANADVNFLVIN